MKNLLFLIAILLVITSCKKDEGTVPEPGVVDVVVEDQDLVEQNLVSKWTGMIADGKGTTENVDVTVEKMVIGEKVATGKFFDITFSCGFEWTYESFTKGIVTFREKTLAPNICYDGLAVKTHFENDNFDDLHLQIYVPDLNATFTGVLSRE